jgi:L-lactate dehydrogenase complex protein LldG
MADKEISMSGRDRILGRVRTALDDATPEPIPTARIVFPETTEEQRIERFFAALEKLGVKTHRAASADDAHRYVEELSSGRPAVASNSPVLSRCGIPDILGVQSRFTSLVNLRQACATASLGITGADYALADTGTLVMLSSQEEARMISLLPPVHLAIVPRERLLTGLDELFTVTPKPAARSSSMVLITGPSRTADIEQILVRGVHGPGEVHIVLL